MILSFLKGGPVDGCVSVRSYGARGDGVTDDTLALQRAINAGGATILPIGQYRHTGLSLPSGAMLIGMGAGGAVAGGQTPVPAGQRSTLVLASGANGDSISIPAGASHGTIWGIEIDGSKSTQTAGTGAGIRLAAAGATETSHWTIDSCYVHDTRSHGLAVGANRTGTHASSSYFVACGLSDAASGSGIDVRGPDTVIDGCGVSSAWSDSLTIGADACRVLGGTFRSNQAGAATPGGGVTILDGFSRAVLTGVSINRCQGHGVYIGFGSVSNTIEGCLLHSNSQRADGSAFHVFHSGAVGATYNALTGCVIAKNDPTASANRPFSSIWVDAGAVLLGKGTNTIDPASAGGGGTVNDVTRYLAAA